MARIRQHLPHAPIGEAIIDLQIPAESTEFGKVKEFSAAVENYDVVAPLFSFQTSWEVSKADGIRDRSKSSEVGVRLHSRDSKYVLQARADGLALSIECESSGRLELSLYRASNVGNEEVWEICRKHVDDTQFQRIAKARGTCLAEEFLNQGITFDPNGKPHIRHVDAINWPVEKHEIKNIQQKIAQTMSLELRPK